tara:strand:+ start:197 stop:838 length:642 start_codon:yes stop_codon:yes gene_type:complete
MKKDKLPKTIPVFPLSNFIIFHNIKVPLNIFEQRYIKMIDECMKGNRIIGMIQPKKNDQLKKPDLYNVGCAGKIISFNETKDNRYLIILNGICRFRVINEISNSKIYRECNVKFDEYIDDLNTKTEDIKFSDINLIYNNLEQLFKKEGFILNLKEMGKKNLDQTINSLSMASPFSLEEKQVLLETKNLKLRKEKLEEIIKTYVLDNFSNNTLQ